MIRLRPALPALLTSALLAAAAASAQAAPPRGKLASGLPIAFSSRPSADGARRTLPAAKSAPVLIHFASAPTESDVAELRALGVTVETRRDGAPRARGLYVAADLPASSLAKVAALSRVTRIALDGSPFVPPRPLDVTAREIQATDVWRALSPGGLPLTGAGVTVCDVDSGIDVFHPFFFRADAGYFAWIDENDDGAFSPDVDTVDIDGARVVLRVFNAPVTAYWDAAPLFGTEDPALAVGMDYLFADLDGDGTRDFGRDEGFSDATPAFGEPLFAVDDVDGDGVFDVGEKLVRLGTSKIASVRVDNKIFLRGESLIDVVRRDEIGHGTGAAGVIAGGQPGLSRNVGIAPDADLVMASDTQGGALVKMADYCVDEGARVVLHEYAPWVGYDLDGSSDMEALIDDTSAAGVSHINPAGNLSGSEKLMKRTIPAGVETVIPIEAPGGPYNVIGISLLWRDPSRDLVVTLEDPTGAIGAAAALDDVAYDPFHDGLLFYSERHVSSRGTARIDFYVFGSGQNPPPIDSGTWSLHITDPAPQGSPDLPIIGYVLDDLSSWGHGIYFPESPSEEHLIGYPGTADHGLAVAAYTGHGFFGGTEGTRAGYSGRGHRIDGEAILSISAPDDPITSAFHPEHPASYQIYGGTSGASPHVAGAAALLIQDDPSRTGDAIRDAIRSGALADDVVGAAPNDDYGYGKLRAYRSLYGVDPPEGSPPSITVTDAWVAIGYPVAVPITLSDPDEPASALRVEIDRDYDGTYDETVTGPAFEVAYNTYGWRFLKLRATDSTGRQSTALAAIKVIDEIEGSGTGGASPTGIGPALIAGGGCATRPEPSDEGSASLFLAAAMVLVARAKRRVS